jgi:hypothetical protein
MPYTPSAACPFVPLGADEFGFLPEALLMSVRDSWAESNKQIET